MVINLLIFLINPVLGLITYAAKLLNRKNIDDFLYKGFYALLAIFLGFINMTKIPESDLAYHASQYLEAANYTFLNYLSWLGKEVIFYSFNYLFYYLSGGSVKFWILTITFISYFLLFLSIHKFFRYFNQSRGIIFFAVIIAAFFPQLFSLSAHLIRQFLAASILMYFLVERLLIKRTLWVLIVVGVFVHSTSIIFYPLAFVGFLKNRLQMRNLKYFFVLGCVLFFYQLVAQILLPVVSGAGALQYALERASSDTRFDLGEFSIINYLFLLMLFIILLYLIFIKRIGQQFQGLNHFSNILLILMFFIVINVRQSELSNRFFFYVWFFFPFIIPLYLRNAKLFLLRITISFLLVGFFIYRLNNGAWKYDSISSLMFSPSLLYFIRPEFKIY